MKIAQLLAESGYKEQVSAATAKRFDTICNENKIKVKKIAPPGCEFKRSKNGFLYTVVFASNGRVSFSNKFDENNIDTILDALAQHVRSLIKEGAQSFTSVCPKCGGRGTIRSFAHIDNGVCFKCNGFGID